MSESLSPQDAPRREDIQRRPQSTTFPKGHCCGYRGTENSSHAALRGPAEPSGGGWYAPSIFISLPRRVTPAAGSDSGGPGSDPRVIFGGCPAHFCCVMRTWHLQKPFTISGDSKRSLTARVPGAFHGYSPKTTPCAHRSQRGMLSWSPMEGTEGARQTPAKQGILRLR